MNRILYGVVSVAAILAASVGLEGASAALPPLRAQDGTVVLGGSASTEASDHVGSLETYFLQASRDGAYHGKNTAQQLTLEFSAQEARLEHARGTAALRLLGYGYGARLRTPADVNPTAASNRLEYRRGELTEWYVNTAGGVEQGFTLDQRPGVARAGDPLVIALAVTGGLDPILAPAGDAVLFESQGQDVFRYAGLRSWDARGREIASRLEVQGKQIHLIVDDRDAEYPLTVDPVATPTSFKMATDSPFSGLPPFLTNPQSIVAADFFGGTIPGLAVANAGGFVTIFEGNGDGTFLQISSFNTQGPRALAAGDFNNDGCPDLAVVNSYAGVSVWLNIKLSTTCTGVFALSNTYITGSVPEAVAVGNFTNLTFPLVHGTPCEDLAVSDNGSNTVTIFINMCNGTGKFFDAPPTPPVVLPTGNGPVGVAIADFNRDGFNDLAVVNSSDGTLTVWLGTGIGGVFFGGTFPLGAIPIRTLNLGQTIAVGDFNHDHYPDIAISTDEGVVVLINSALPPSIPPSVGFLEPPAAPYAADLLPDSVAVGDFNQDGILDLAVTNAISNDVSILIGAGTGGIGNGTFLPPVNFPVGTLPTSVAVGAFNSINNNYLGVAVTNFGDSPGDVTVYLGTVWTISVVSGSDQGTQVGAPFAKPLVVQVQDTDPPGPPTAVVGANVTFTAPTFGASAVVSPAPPTNGSGETQAMATANDIPGSYNVTAMAGFAATTTFYLTNTGDPAIAAVGGTPQSTAVSTAFPLQLQAKVTDAFGNPISGQSVTFVVSPGVTGASGTLTSPATVPTNSSGIATASITANGTAGTFQVTAGASGVGSINFVLTNIGSPAAILAVSGSGQSVGVNQPFAAPLVAKVTDSAGDGISGVTVTFTVNPMNGAGATFAGGLTSATAVTTSGGTATSPALTSNGTGGTYTVTASASGTGSTTFNLTNASGIIVPNVTVEAGSWTLLPVTLGAPATTTVYVTLTSNNTSIAAMSPTNAQTPGTIIFLAGSTTPTFTPKIYGIADGSTTVTATGYGLPSGTGNVQVTQ